MISLINILSLLVLFSIFDQTLGVEFTFELEDNAKQCFFQDIEKGTSATLDFQVSFIKSLTYKLKFLWTGAAVTCNAMLGINSLFC